MHIEIESARLLNRLDIRFHAYQQAARKCFNDDTLSTDCVKVARQNLAYALIQAEYLLPGMYQSTRIVELQATIKTIRDGIGPVINTLYDGITYDSLIGTTFDEVISIEPRYVNMSLLNIERQLEGKYTFVAQNANFGELDEAACEQYATDRVIQRLVLSNIHPDEYPIHSHLVKKGPVTMYYKWVTIPKSSAQDILSTILKAYRIEQ